MMKLKKLKISQIGCGWLGLPLGEALVQSGHDLVSTTRTPLKQFALSKNFETHLFDVTKDSLDQRLLSADLIIYTIPPLGQGEVERFFKTVSPEKKIIFISSTSVFGKSSGMVDDNSSQNPQTKNGKSLSQSESFLRSLFKNLTIIRPGGLYSEDRHPVYSLQGKKELTTGSELLHLVHRDDVIEAIKKIIENQLWSENFNLINDVRVPKEEYYTAKALELKLTPPQFTPTLLENPTNISNEKSKKRLSLNYKNY
jgi:nucleoside-diphosphate-sugar epimerase